MQTIEATIKGISAMLMHNGRLCDPLDPHTRRLKELTKKRSKTDEDGEEIADAEWLAGLYYSEEPAKDGKPIGLYLPLDNIQRMILDAAKRIKKGKLSIGIMPDSDNGIGFPINSPLSRDLDAMRDDPRYRFRKPVTINRAKVVTTRPRIPAGWSAKLTLLVDPSIIDVSDVPQILDIAGRVIGLGDWRPGGSTPGHFGRFVVESLDLVTDSKRKSLIKGL